LWFTDIKAPCLYRFDPAGAALRRWDAPSQIGWVLPADDGTMLAGLQDGLYRFDPDHGQFDPFRLLDHGRHIRLNDAASDVHGRLWFGTMDDGESEPNGAWFRFDRGKVERTALPKVAISNGPALSPDGSLLYHVDTRAGLISRCAVSESGEIGKS